jgi:hypothetical protein
MALNVTDSGLAHYLDVFHKEYSGTVERLIPAHLRGNLLRYSLLGTSSIAGYVSTQYGAGFEYVPGERGFR